MKLRVCCVAAAAALVMASGAMARDFVPGDLVVSLVGDGSGALSGAATAWQLQEFTTGGSAVGGILNLNSIAPAGQFFTGTGSATSEGFLTLSSNGQYLTMGGYNAMPGTASVASTTSAANPRTVARIGFNGAGDFSTLLSDAYSGGNIRSVASTDGSDFWTGGTASASGGARYATLGATTSTMLSSTPTNLRVVNIFNGQLYASSASGAFQGISAIGSGLPTTSGQTTTLLPGFPTTSGPSPYDFYFANASTLYVADDRATTSGGGLQKWTFDGTNWALQYTMNAGLTAGLRGLTAGEDPASGRLVFYATTADTVNATTGNKLVSVVDSGAGSMFNTLYTAPGNVALRGVDFAPVPAPGSVAVLSLGLLAAARRRRA